MEPCRNKSCKGRAPVTGAGYGKVVPALKEMAQESLYSSVSMELMERKGEEQGEDRRGQDRTGQEKRGEEVRALWLRVKFLSESDQVILSEAT